MGNACGTIALIHSFANADIPLAADSPLARFLAAVKHMNPTERAAYMQTGVEASAIARLHATSSRQGQSDTPDAQEDVSLHYVAMAVVDGVLYEFDGRKQAPVCHGACVDVLEGGVRVAREFMARDPENLSFTAIALVKED